MQKSFADCSKCSRYQNDGKVCLTNSKRNIQKVDVVYLIDRIDKWEELKVYAEKKRQRYLITSPILCESIDDDDFQTVVDLCKINAMTIINQCNPTKVITIGHISCNFKLDGVKVEAWPDIETFQSDYDINQIANELKISLEMVNEHPSDVKPVENVKMWGNNKKPYSFKIPDKYYTSEYRLVDVQAIINQSRVIYIFRDRHNKKEYYEVPIKQNDFYWYESFSTDNQIIERIENLELKIGNYKSRCTNQRGYSGDINIATLHSIDYFLHTEEEALAIKKNALHFDIEIYTYRDKTFPDPLTASYPISAVSFRMNDDSDMNHIYLLKLDGDIDPRIDDIVKSKKYPTLNIFNDEYTLLMSFLAAIRKNNPDFICGWNSNRFDMPYIISRMKKLNIQSKELSPFGNLYANGHGKVICTGLVCLDQLQLYKDLTYITLPSYSLDNVAKKEKVGQKIPYDGDLNTLYNDDIDKYIEYSLNDTFLLKGIEDETQHISLQDELRQVSTNTHDGAGSTLGQAEGLLASSMKRQGLVARNKSNKSEKEKLPGAYVFEARGGLYDGLLCDFDFTSLYPSIINTWNLGHDTLIARLCDENDKFDIIYQKEKLKDKQIEIILDPVHNTTKTTISLTDLEKLISDNSACLNIAGTIFKGRDKKESIFYTVIDTLFNGRKTYKNKMFEAKENGESRQVNIFNGKQMAYKILANSLYGALGNEHFRFYNIDIAKSITLTGQELLKYCAVHCDDYLIHRGNMPDFKMNVNFLNKVKLLNDVLYGDTDSIFVYLTDFLKDKGIKVSKSPEVQNEIDKIQNYINQIALNAFLNSHNIQSSDSMIFLKNEYLFSKYYTLYGKKHYASKVISQEGKDISFIDIKGLEMKRSEIPPRSQELLTQILDIILQDDIKKYEIKGKIDTLVDETRKEMELLVEQRNNSIARTVSYSKPLNQYKNTPQHIKGMLIWNCLAGLDDFRYGSKGKLWNIKAIDLECAPESVKARYYDVFLKKYNIQDLNCICVPETVDGLPEWFIPDMKKIISYCCDDRVANLTEPIWRESQNKLLFG